MELVQEQILKTIGPIIPVLSARSQISRQISDFVFFFVVCGLYFVYVCVMQEYVICWPKKGDSFVQVKNLGDIGYFQYQRNIC